MTIQAQIPTPTSGSFPGDPHTHRMQAEYLISTDCYALLDHRTRGRTIALGDAPPGRYLSIEDGEDVRLIPLDRPITHIGRGLTADIRLEDHKVSRRHAIIAQRGDRTRVLDDRSHNGTFVNGRPVTVSYLADGDVLRLAGVVMRFVEVAPQIQAAPAHRRMPLPVRAPGAMVVG
jgi:FHA domain